MSPGYLAPIPPLNPGLRIGVIRKNIATDNLIFLDLQKLENTKMLNNFHVIII